MRVLAYAALEALLIASCSVRVLAYAALEALLIVLTAIRLRLRAHP